MIDYINAITDAPIEDTAPQPEQATDPPALRKPVTHTMEIAHSTARYLMQNQRGRKLIERLARNPTTTTS